MFSGVERLPGASALHRWADWAELLTLTAPGSSLSMSELRETAELRKDFIASESQDDQDPQEREREPLIEDAEREPSEFRDALSKRAGDILNYLIDRADRYGASYPFEIDRDKRLISMRQLTDSRRLYVFVLACAGLRYVGFEDRTRLTSRFELLCLQALHHMLPPYSEVHLFGKNPIGTDRYRGLLIDKIKQLAHDLGEEHSVKESDFETGDTGDNGLDLVAWVPLADRMPGRIAVFGQAACTPEWISKQHSSSAPAWRAMIPFTSDPQNMVFIPYDYRRPGGEWYTRRHIQQSIVIDRHRLIHRLADSLEPAAPLKIDSAIMEILQLSDLDVAIQRSISEL